MLTNRPTPQPAPDHRPVPRRSWSCRISQLRDLVQLHLATQNAPDRAKA